MKKLLFPVVVLAAVVVGYLILSSNDGDETSVTSLDVPKGATNAVQQLPEQVAPVDGENSDWPAEPPVQARQETAVKEDIPWLVDAPESLAGSDEHVRVALAVLSAELGKWFVPDEIIRRARGWICKGLPKGDGERFERREVP